jgi:hypothetical protein
MTGLMFTLIGILLISDLQVVSVEAAPLPDANFSAEMESSLLEANAGMMQSNISIGDRVWDDLDQDGKQDAGEPGLSGVTVQLWNSAKTSMLATTTTNGSGIYSFSIAPGTYRVRVVLPNINDQFSPRLAAGTTTANDSNFYPSGADFGFTPAYVFSASTTSVDAGIIKYRTPTPTRTPTPINVGNFVWDDIDHDGRQDAGEPGIAGVTVQLWNSAKTQLIDSDVTNANGIYTLVAPLPGNYRVRVILPNINDQFSPMDEAGGDDGLDSDINPSGVNFGFTDIYAFASNLISITSIDAGIIIYRTPTPTRTPTPVNIGNFVWHDLDGDGIQDAGEPGIPGVTLQVWNDILTIMYDETVSNASGNYTLQTPGPGSFRVRALLPSSASSFSPDNVGANDNIDSDINDSGTYVGYTNTIVIAANVISITSVDVGFDAYAPPSPTPTRTYTPPAPDINIISNGNFSNGLNDWAFSNTTQVVSGGAMQIAPTSPGGSFFQFVNFNSAGGIFEVNFRASNSSGTVKTLNLIVRDTDWTPQYNCVFNLAANAPYQNYRMRFDTTASFIPMVFQGVLSGDSSMGLLIDDISMVRRTGIFVPSTECIVAPPANTNLIYDGGFNQGTVNWAAFNAAMQVVNIGGDNGNIMELARWNGTPNGGFYQFNPYSAPANGVFEFTFEMGNQSNQSRVINMLVRNADWTDNHSCFITVPANTPLQDYTILLRTSVAWANIVVQGWIQVGDYTGTPPLPFRFDNLTVEYQPGSAYAGSTQCPGAPPMPQRPSLTPTVTATASFTATASETPTSTVTPTPSMTMTASLTASATSTAEPSTSEPPTLTPVATETPTDIPTDTATFTPEPITAEPPNATPEPSTATPEPPTNTSEPPPEVTQDP